MFRKLCLRLQVRRWGCIDSVQHLRRRYFSYLENLIHSFWILLVYEKGNVTLYIGDNFRISWISKKLFILWRCKDLNMYFVCGRTVGERWIPEDLEGSSRDTIEVKALHMLGRTEESIEKLNQGFDQIEIDSSVIQAAWPVLQPARVSNVES